MKKKIIIPAVAVVVVIIIIIGVSISNTGTEVSVFTVKKGNIRESIEIRGTVELDKSNNVYSQFTGRILNINVKEGDTVDINTELANMDVENLQLALKKARAGYDSAKASLEELKMGARQEQIREAQAAVNASKARLDELKRGADEETISQAQSAVDSAKSAINSAQINLENAQYNYESSIESEPQVIAQSEAVVESAHAAYKQAQISMEKASEDYDNSVSAYERSQALYEVGSISKVQLEEAENVMYNAQKALANAEQNVNSANAQYLQAKAQLDKLRIDVKKEREALNNSVLTATQQLESAKSQHQSSLSELERIKKGPSAETIRMTEAEYEQALARLQSLKNGPTEQSIQVAQANVEQAKIQLEELENSLGKAVIYSQMKGVVLSKYVFEGQSVQEGTLLFEIGDVESDYIDAFVLADDAVKIKKGQNVIISGDVLGDKEIMGKVDYIAPKAQSRVSSLGIKQSEIEVKISYESDETELKPGYGADIDIITNEKSSVYVPYKAVFEHEGKDSVFVVKNGVAEIRNVTTGIENNDNIEIIEGLTQDEVVVAEPENDLEPGDRIKEK